MSADRWIRVPIGEGSEPYRSIRFDRTILIVARTVTTTAWLLDILVDVIADPRIQILFTVEDESPSVYHEGVRRMLSEMEAPVIPWSQAVDTAFDLAICSSFNGTLSALHSPLFITLHGPGIGKPASVLRGGLVPVPTRLAEQYPDRSGPVSTVVLSHDEQRRFLPDQTGVEILIAGDPTFDRMTSSLPLRERYRAALGLQGNERLVLLTSTWGPGSQFGTHPDLSHEVAKALPLDEWRVAFVIHPNVWYGHGKWQIRTWLRRAIDAGVLLVPPETDAWQAAVVAADLLVADHGSVSLYASAIGRPVLTAGFSHGLVVDDVPLAELGRRAPALDLNAGLRAQIQRAESQHDPAEFADLVERISAAPRRSASIIRRSLYSLLDLQMPNRPTRPHTVAVPAVRFPPTDAHLAFAGPTGSSRGRTAVSVERFPADASETTPFLPRASATSWSRSRHHGRSCSRVQRS